MVLGFIGVAIGAILGKVTDGISALTSFVGRILSFAPKPIKIGIFLIVGIGLLATIMNWFIGIEYVCSEDTVYKADSMLWAIGAKSQEPVLEFEQGVTEGVEERFFRTDEAETPIPPTLQQPAAIDYLTDADFAQIAFTQFGTFLAPNGDVTPELTSVDDDVVVMAVPLRYQGEDITEFSAVSDMLNSVGGILTVSKTAELYICKLDDDFIPGPLEEIVLEREYGNAQAGQCFLKHASQSPDTVIDPFQGCPFGSQQIAVVTYNVQRIEDTSERTIESTSPGEVEVQVDGASWSFNVYYKNPTTSWWLRAFDIAQDRNLNACPQSPHEGAILLAPNPVQFNENLFQGPLLVGGVLGGVEEDIPEQAGYVVAQYVPLDSVGVETIVRDEGTEQRSSFIQSNREHFNVAKFSSDDVVTYACTDNQEVTVEVYGIQVFDKIFLVTFLFFIGVISFLRWVGLI